MKYWIPIVFVEVYLIFTLLIFSFGPIEYFLVDAPIFWFFIFLYHSSMIIGYIVGIVPFNIRRKVRYSLEEISPTKIRFLIFFAFFSFLIGYKNSTMSDSLIPYDFFDNIVKGFLASEDQYTDSKMRLENYSGDKLMNIINFFIAFSKIILIPIIVFYWERLGAISKFVALIVSFSPVFSGISTGTNKPLFDFVIIYGSSLVLYFLSSYYRIGKFNLRSRAFFIYTILVAFCLAILFFGMAMQGRGGDVSYIESTSGLGHLKIDDAYRNLDGDSFLSYTYVWFSNYLVQGYYGFSQALTKDFTSTFGVGNSQFLLRQAEWVTGYDFSIDTYQHKVDAAWGELAQWHSLYSYIANDVSFIGVAVFNFVMGLYLAKLWRSFLDRNNFYSKMLLPLFVLLVIFTPANNQVFGFLETFSAFLFMSILWAYSMRKRSFLSK